MLKYLFLIVLFFCLSACQSRVSKQELIAYLQESSHELSQEYKQAQIALTVTYRPHELVAYTELKGVEAKQQRDSILRQYQDYIYFTLSLSNNKQTIFTGNTAQAFHENLRKLAFRMGDYVSLRCDEKILAFVDAYLPRTFGMGESTDILLVFSNKDKQGTGDYRLHIQDISLNLLPHTFTFRQKDIQNIPSLKS